MVFFTIYKAIFPEKDMANNKLADSPLDVVYG